MTDLALLSATEIADRVARRDLRAFDIIEQTLRRIERLEPAVCAWAWRDASRVLSAAEDLDAALDRGDAPRRLAGVPLGVKDIFNTADMPTEMGSRIWEGFQPGNDARAVFNARYDGAIVVGKTRTSEFAVHEPTEVRNPRRLQHAPGTSSAGSAAAVAAGMVPLALGSQTAASCIRPASYCGIFGFKPSYGAVPRTGVLKTTDTLDTIAWFARTIDDIELLFESIRVRGRNYPLVHRHLVRRPLSEPIRIGVVRGPHWAAAMPDAREALSRAIAQLSREAQFVVEERDLPEAAEIFDAHELIYCKALSYYFRAEQRNDRAKISAVLLSMLEHGEGITPDAYHRAIHRQAELTRTINERFADTVWVTLAAASEAPRGLRSPDLPDTSKIWTYLGMPALSVPAAVGATGLPIGLQLVAPKYGDYRILDVARRLVDVLNVRVEVAEPRPEESPVG